MPALTQLCLPHTYHLARLCSVCSFCWGAVAGGAIGAEFLLPAGMDCDVDLVFQQLHALLLPCGLTLCTLRNVSTIPCYPLIFLHPFGWSASGGGWPFNLLGFPSFSGERRKGSSMCTTLHSTRTPNTALRDLAAGVWPSFLCGVSAVSVHWRCSVSAGVHPWCHLHVFICMCVVSARRIDLGFSRAS